MTAEQKSIILGHISEIEDKLKAKLKSVSLCGAIDPDSTLPVNAIMRTILESVATDYISSNDKEYRNLKHFV